MVAIPEKKSRPGLSCRGFGKDRKDINTWKEENIGRLPRKFTKKDQKDIGEDDARGNR
ncbi:MAG: hypothetical protein GXP63_00155 [DPANN group archaeon]|nr:hypothetical protein [DPANN group archaeon]